MEIKNGFNPESLQVLIRVRPLNNSESIDNDENESKFVVDIQDSSALSVSNSDGTRVFHFSFDAVLGPTSSQLDVYNIVRECTVSLLSGVNATIFAYGQTSSGKTFSMYGPSSESGSRTVIDDASLIGIIPRAVQEIFELAVNIEVLTLSVYCSFVQIYNESLFDMLRDSSMASPLSVREDVKGEIYVEGLSEYNVKSVDETLQLLRVAENNRAIRETNMNLFSSRSHSIFQIFLEQKRIATDGGEISLRSKFNLVDLAGSEKWNLQRDKDMRDAQITEMTNINLSLHTLGRCISALGIK
jgi:PHD/YefM family antitoxin component YafN of YafNO toxin-antitoxin module